MAAAPALLVSSDAQAEIVCSRPQRYGAGLVRQCSVGIRIGPSLTAQQRCDQWCWAACIEAAFALRGYRVAQERIVETLYGDRFVCAPAVGVNIANTIARPWTDDRGRRFRGLVRVVTDVQFGVRNPNALRIAADFLQRGVPLITGALGHATLMTAMSYVEDNFGRRQLQEIILRDPWPGRRNRRRMTPREFYGTTFLAAVTAS